MVVSNKPITRLRAAIRLAVTLLLRTLTLMTLQATVAFSQSEPTVEDFQRTVVADGLDLPMEFQISEDGRVFIASKCGGIYAWHLDSGSAQQTSVLPNVRCEWEDGVLSVALDPNFTQNGYIYFQYTAPGSLTRVSRYTVNPDSSLDMGSESVLLEWQTGNEAHGHMGGSIHFDPEGNLLISTGDNMAAGGYYTDSAQATSGNTNDLRGKILRITPTADGGYTIPEGNLFEGDELHRPEIYGMGFRNPFRLNIDPETGYAYVGDIGPDASTASDEGPMGMDEITELSEAGNYGWPWVVGFNEPYAGFDPNNLVNNYSGNTGATDIPDAKPALWTILHRAIMAGPVYRFDESIDSDTKLPAYYHGKLIFWDFNSSKFFTLDVSSGDPRPEAVDFPIDTAGFQGAIDAELDPRTHELYVLQWGSGCCSKEPYGGGALYRFEYIGDRDSGPNLAVGGLATATSEVAGNLAMYAIDGDPTTRWETEYSDPQTLNVDLQHEAVIGSIGLTWEAAYSSEYRIEASRDGVNWEVLVDINDGTGGTRLHVVESQTAYRYVRYIGLARGTAYGHSLFEFQIFGGEEDEPPEELTEFAYLNMPRTLDSEFTDVPQFLSQTGAFSDTANLVPSENMIPFEPNSQLWSDRADKERWISIPAETQVNWHETENWSYPQGTVAVKHFDLPLDANDPGEAKRLETRLLVVQANGQVYGVTYKWNDQQTDAELLTDSLTEDIDITGADGSVWTQTWAYPSPSECVDCHNAESSQLLGLSTRQLNGDLAYPGGATENQLAHWNNRGLFAPGFSNTQIDGFDQTAAITDGSASLEHRIKSYLDTNCAHCHGTGNGGSQWDARFNTPLNEMQIVDEQTTGIRNYFNYYGIEDAEVVSSGAPHESILYIRDKSVDPDDRMPPIARALEHTEYIDVLEQWIGSLDSAADPGTETLLSSGAPASSSSVEGGYVASLATDGNPDTRWSSDFDDPQSITIDLEEIYSISRIVLNWEAAYGSAYVIEGSLDGNNWEEILTQSSGTGGIETYENLSGAYRYIRLTGTERATPYGYSLWEFQVFGTSSVPGTPSISISSPVAGQGYTADDSLSLQVAVSDSGWFSDGGLYSYSLDGGDAVEVSHGNAVNLGSLNVGSHDIQVTLLDDQGQVVGDSRSVNFSVEEMDGTTPPTPGPSQLTPVGATASSGDAVYAIDGDAGSRWESEFSDPQYIQLDMGESIYFTGVSLDWEAAYASSYRIEVSQDGNTWDTVYSTESGHGGVSDIALNGQQGRYIRMYGTVRATTYGYSLWAFDVYGLVADPDLPLVSIDAPTEGEEIPEGQSVQLQVGVSDTTWFANGGSYNYSLDNAGTVNVSSANSVDLGTLPTGRHTLRVSLVDSDGVEVSVPRTLNFRVSCGNDCPNVLVFSKTSGFRHGSIPAGIAMVEAIGAENGYTVTASEDASLFTEANLAQYSTIVFMNTTGDIFTDDQKAAFRAYIEGGGGYVGSHSAADTEHSWSWYTDTLLAGAEFVHHGDGIPYARVEIEQTDDHTVNHIGSEWFIADEWYFWESNPRDEGNVEVLAILDRTSYDSNYADEDHPVIFKNTVGQGRVFYTALGHVDANFSDPNMVEKIRKAIEWTSGD